MTTYILTRLPDVDGEVNYTWGPKESQRPMFPYKLISWDWKWIRKEAEKLKVGESKEYKENV